ncbi:MAG: hypothetical protein EXR51_09890 [Dehalococcoidia bacterium]|nr:hypothetical protein [Dehalococcoidia bacterium]
MPLPIPNTQDEHACTGNQGVAEYPVNPAAPRPAWADVGNLRHLSNTLAPNGTPGATTHSQYSSRKDATSAWLHRGASPKTTYTGPGKPPGYKDGPITFSSDWMVFGLGPFEFLPGTVATAPPNGAAVPYAAVDAAACYTNVFRNFVEQTFNNQPTITSVNQVHLVPEDCTAGSPPVAAWVDFDQLYTQKHVLEYFDPRYALYEVFRGNVQPGGAVLNVELIYPRGAATTLAIDGGYDYQVCAATSIAGPCVASPWLWVGYPPMNLRAWGDNSSGQLGDGTNTQRSTPVTPFSPVFVGVAAGLSHSLGYTPDLHAWAWGANGSGQLGNNSTTSSSTPVQVVGLDGTGVLSGVVGVAAGWSSSVAVLGDGTVVTWGPNEFIWAWGYNNHGKLGIGNTDHQPAPVQVSQATGLNFATKLVSTARHSFALKSDGTLWAWGENSDGRLGDGTILDKWTPVQIPLSNVVSMGAGIVNSVAVKDDGTVWPWGANSNGELGSGAVGGPRLSPGKVAGHSDFQWVTAGGSLDRGFPLAIKDNGTVWSWGDNTWGQLGYNTTIDRLLPVQVAGIRGEALRAAVTH